LQQRKHLHGAIDPLCGRLFTFLHLGAGRYSICRHPRSRAGRLTQLLWDVNGNVSMEQDGKETPKGKS
jgi:hypothetical protein